MAKMRARANRRKRFGGNREHRESNRGFMPARRKRYVCADPHCPELGPHYHYDEPYGDTDDDTGGGD